LLLFVHKKKRFLHIKRMDPIDIVAADIGGTHARYAIATIQNGKVTSLGEPVTLLARDHASLASSWQAFARALNRPLPQAASIAVACPIAGDILKLTNNPWVIRPATLAAELNLDALTLINDFGAMGHALSQMPATDLQHLAGPDIPLPETGVITVIGPGTGFGVAHVLRRDGRHHVIECEGGHTDFSPLDHLEDSILQHLRSRFGRVSVERIVSGPGLANIHEALAAIEGQQIQPGEDKELWARAIAGADTLASAALSRFCLSLGAVAGDLALAQGANAVVITGGIAPRIAHLLPTSGFTERFRAKGRFDRMMSEIPVKLMTHPNPGLLGVAAAFAELRK
jgi:glucokinase